MSVLQATMSRRPAWVCRQRIEAPQDGCPPAAALSIASMRMHEDRLAARDAARGDLRGHLCWHSSGCGAMCRGGGCRHLFQSISASTIERWGAEGGLDGTKWPAITCSTWW